jgi:hypothetical protein
MCYDRSWKRFSVSRLDHRVHKPGHPSSKSLCFQNWTTLCSLYGNIADAPYPPRKQWHLTYKAKAEWGAVTAWDEPAQIKRAMEWIGDRNLIDTACKGGQAMHRCGRGFILHSSDSATGGKTPYHHFAYQMQFVYSFLLIRLLEWNRNSLVNTETTLRAGRSRVRIPAGGIDFSLLPNVQTGSNSNSIGIGVFPPVVQRPRHLHWPSKLET